MLPTRFCTNLGLGLSWPLCPRSICMDGKGHPEGLRPLCLSPGPCHLNRKHSRPHRDPAHGQGLSGGAE